jgi:hypothetical protein
MLSRPSASSRRYASLHVRLQNLLRHQRCVTMPKRPPQWSQDWCCLITPSHASWIGEGARSSQLVPRAYELLAGGPRSNGTAHTAVKMVSSWARNGFNHVSSRPAPRCRRTWRRERTRLTCSTICAGLSHRRLRSRLALQSSCGSWVPGSRFARPGHEISCIDPSAMALRIWGGPPARPDSEGFRSAPRTRACFRASLRVR